MQITRSLKLAWPVLVVLVALSGQAFSSIVAVGSCTSLNNYATIQQAVNGVLPEAQSKFAPVLITNRLSLARN
jgi:hypothetical protein